MLELPDDVGGDQLGIGVGIGDHGDLGGPREQVDPDAAEQLTLRLGDVCVAGADDHVNRVDVLQAERKRGESVGAADAHDRVGPAD